jgi:hypothetical protein
MGSRPIPVAHQLSNSVFPTELGRNYERRRLAPLETLGLIYIIAEREKPRGDDGHVWL